MCDPSIMGIASMASGMADAFGQQSAQRQQEEEYNKWMKQQDKNREEENARQEVLRQQAEQARTQGVNQLSGTSQTIQQGREQNRLQNYLIEQDPLTKEFSGEGAPDSLTGANYNPVSGTMQPVSDKFLLSGQKGGDEVFKADLASKLNAASKQVRGKIGDMATLASYGPSFGGLDQFSDQALIASGMTIDEINNFRNGSMKAYGVRQDVDPKHVVYQSGLKL